MCEKRWGYGREMFWTESDILSADKIYTSICSLSTIKWIPKMFVYNGCKIYMFPFSVWEEEAFCKISSDVKSQCVSISKFYNVFSYLLSWARDRTSQRGAAAGWWERESNAVSN